MKRVLLFFFFVPSLTWAQRIPTRSISTIDLVNLSLSIGVATVFCLFFRFCRRGQKKQLLLLEAEYQAALLGIDKIRAYELGFLYYCSLRPDNKPTEEDQQKLIHELNQMGFINPERYPVPLK